MEPAGPAAYWPSRTEDRVWRAEPAQLAGIGGWHRLMAPVVALGDGLPYSVGLLVAVRLAWLTGERCRSRYGLAFRG
jgi:hypothetical protein